MVLQGLPRLGNSRLFRILIAWLGDSADGLRRWPQ